jgi:hypothetical protein
VREEGLYWSSPDINFVSFLTQKATKTIIGIGSLGAMPIKRSLIMGTIEKYTLTK